MFTKILYTKFIFNVLCKTVYLRPSKIYNFTKYIFSCYFSSMSKASCYIITLQNVLHCFLQFALNHQLFCKGQSQNKLMRMYLINLFRA